MAKKEGNTALSYVYKILMNSLYGRFGINPRSTITEICDKERFDIILNSGNFIFGDSLNDSHYICSYIANNKVSGDSWKPPRIAAVQIAADITAYARIYIHPFLIEDCFYTEKDSVVLSQPLADEFISNEEIGKFKLEYKVQEGIFNAPRLYILTF